MYPFWLRREETKTCLETRVRWLSNSSTTPHCMSIDEELYGTMRVGSSGFGHVIMCQPGRWILR